MNNRYVIPKELRDLVGITYDKPYALCLEDDNVFFLIETSQANEETVLTVLPIEKKGRIIIPQKILRHYRIQDQNPFIFVQNKRIYISFAE